MKNTTEREALIIFLFEVIINERNKKDNDI